MPVPAALAIGAQMLPFLISALAGGPERVDPNDALRKLLGQFEGFLQPGIDAGMLAAMLGGSRVGSALSQDVSSSIGRLGGGTVGTARVMRGLASSAASTRALEGGAQAVAKGRETAASLAAGSLPAYLQGLQATRPSTGFQNFAQALGGFTATGGNPFMQMLQQLFGGGGGGTSSLDALLSATGRGGTL